MHFERYIDELFFYLVGGGVVHFFWTVVAAPVFVPIAVRLQRRTYPEVIRGWFVLNLFLLMWGSLGYYVFLHLAYGKLYVSVDRWVDWYPFIPSGQWVIDQGFGETMKGRLIGSTTLWQLRGVWLAVAVPVWLLSWASTSLSCQLAKGLFPGRRPEEGEQRVL